jgi:hypothetical protein
MSTNGHTNGNGHGKSAMPWITGAVLAPICLAVFGNLFSASISTRERVTALEVQYQHVRDLLESIDHKLDRLSQRK